MDPVSLAMAARLVVRIKKVMDERDSSDASETLVLPSKTEIGQAVSLVFDYQRPSGIWPKYFPMFHFQNAGANYCFTFEMLEALISEIGSSDILRPPKIVDKLNRAIDWCKLNRLRYKTNGLDYFGWNSRWKPQHSPREQTRVLGHRYGALVLAQARRRPIGSDP